MQLFKSLPLALRWSVIISGFVMLVMGSLGWYLISQQTESFRQQSELLGQVVADQLASAASEPLLAGDTLTLQVLVSQQKKHALIHSMEIYDNEGQLQAGAGTPTVVDVKTIMNLPPVEYSHLDWENDDIQAISFYSPVLFNNLNAGLAIVSVDRQPLEKILATLTNALLTTTLGLIALGILLAFPLAHRLAKPIDDLVEAGEALDNKHSKLILAPGENKDAIGRIQMTFQRMGDKLEQKKKVEAAFSRHLSPSIAREVLETADGSTLGGSVLEGSVLFCDIVGFTDLSEDMNPRDVGELLNHYFSYFSLAAESCQGAVDKFIGDCIMILFGVPDEDELHGLHALTSAILMQEITKRINHRRQQQDRPIVEFRLGIHSGEMLAGNLGGEQRMQYTVVGDTVNLAARLCSICEPGGILATKAVIDQASTKAAVRVKAMQAVKVKGRQQMVTPYSIHLNNFIDDVRIRQILERILPED